MTTAKFLRLKADTCLMIARGCFDLACAERMRHLANELKARANQIECEERLDGSAIDWNTSSPRQTSDSH
jgi:hypothetical protein